MSCKVAIGCRIDHKQRYYSRGSHKGDGYCPLPNDTQFSLCMESNMASSMKINMAINDEDKRIMDKPNRAPLLMTVLDV